MKVVARIENKRLILYNYSVGLFYAFDYSRIQGDDYTKPFFQHYTNKNAILELTKETWEKMQNYRLSFNELDIDSFEGPSVTGIMLYNKCNLHCKYCIAYNGHGYSERVKINDCIDLLIDNLISAKVIGVLLSGGEPTINPEIISIMEKFSKHNFYITLDTNGVNMSKELIDILKTNKNITPRISLDSNIEEIHNENRGHFKKTIKNIEMLLKNGVDVRINTVMHQSNIDYLDELANYLVTVGVKQWHIFKVQAAFAPENLAVDDERCAAVIDDVRQKYGDKMNIICKFTKNNDGFASFVIDSEMNCFSTNNQSNEKIIFGNIGESSIMDIWKNAPSDYRFRHVKKYLNR